MKNEIEKAFKAIEDGGNITTNLQKIKDHILELENPSVIPEYFLVSQALNSTGKFESFYNKYYYNIIPNVDKLTTKEYAAQRIEHPLEGVKNVVLVVVPISKDDVYKVKVETVVQVRRTVEANSE